MKKRNELGSMSAIAAVLVLGACAGPEYSPNTDAGRHDGQYSGYAEYGVVQSIELIKYDSSGIGGSSIGIGTIAGAVVGGVVGNQVGSGRGNTAATVLGAAGGAYVGHELENRQPPQKADAYKITVRMDDGAYHALTQGTHAGLRVGDRVRVRNGVLERY